MLSRERARLGYSTRLGWKTHPVRPLRDGPEPVSGSCVHLVSGQEDRLADTDERDLIARLRTREPEALGEVYRRLGSAMTTLASSMLRDREEAHDVVEDALLRVHRAAPDFRGERGLRTWVLRIVANLCRDRLRRRKFIAPNNDDEDPFERAGLSFDPIEEWDGALDQHKLVAAMERAIAALPQDQREIVVMRHRLGLSHAEIMEALGVPEGTVKSRLARALAALREHVTKEIV